MRTPHLNQTTLNQPQLNPLKISKTEQRSYYTDLIAKHGSPLMIVDCARLRQQLRSLRQALPGVDLYYAVKSQPNPDVVRTLANENVHFDVATSGEIELMQQLGIDPARVIHTHPIKRIGDINAALEYGCNTFVVDNIEELEKFIPYRDQVQLILRVSFRSNAKVDLSKKFGCAVDEVLDLLRFAANARIPVQGLSFHVGSQCGTPERIADAISQCGALIQRYNEEAPEHALTLLDIGGGYPVDYEFGTLDIVHYCAIIRAALSHLPQGIRVIAEPGRYLSAPALTGVATIMGKAQRGGQTWYYLDDGVYGSYSGQLFDHTLYPLEVFSDSEALFNSTLSGPTCDSIDVIAEGISLPDLQIGDILVGHVMGAYTSATATDFNAFPRASFVLENEVETMLEFLPLQDMNVLDSLN